MFFKANVSLEQITDWVVGQLSAVHPIAKNGIDIIIKPHKPWRTNEQNRFLMVIMQEIVKFYHETGFMPEGCQKWMMRVDILKEFYKAKFGIEHTRTLDKKAFGDFIDGIQRELVEETQGEWQILQTDSAYLLSLVGEL
jgi:hypothetical protein